MLANLEHYGLEPVCRVLTLAPSSHTKQLRVPENLATCLPENLAT